MKRRERNSLTEKEAKETDTAREGDTSRDKD